MPAATAEIQSEPSIVQMLVSDEAVLRPELGDAGTWVALTVRPPPTLSGVRLVPLMSMPRVPEVTMGRSTEVDASRKFAVCSVENVR